MRYAVLIVGLGPWLGGNLLLDTRSHFCTGAFRSLEWVVEGPGGRYGLIEFGVPGLSAGMPHPSRTVLMVGSCGAIQLERLGRWANSGLLLVHLTAACCCRGGIAYRAEPFSCARDLNENTARDVS